MAGGVLCLEAVWDPKNISDERESVAPLLRIVAQSQGVKLAHFDCGTKEELRHRLSGSRLAGYGTLYLGFHGWAGRIWTDLELLSLEALAALMKNRFEGWDVHVGACLAMKTDGARLSSFKKSIGARIVSGYKRYVYWDEDYAALELAWLTQIVRGRRTLPKYYAKLAKRAGLVIV